METDLKILDTSILDSNADVIVMSANPSLLAGSGVSGVIHKAAGTELEKHVKPLGPIAKARLLFRLHSPLMPSILSMQFALAIMAGKGGRLRGFVRHIKAYYQFVTNCQMYPR